MKKLKEIDPVLFAAFESSTYLAGFHLGAAKSFCTKNKSSDAVYTLLSKSAEMDLSRIETLALLFREEIIEISKQHPKPFDDFTFETLDELYFGVDGPTPNTIESEVFTLLENLKPITH